MASEMVTWLNKAARAIYLATDAAVAHDISPKLREAATLLSSQEAEIERLTKALEKIEAMDSMIDATIRSDGKDRRIVQGPFAQIARAALTPLPEGGNG